MTRRKSTVRPGAFMRADNVGKTVVIEREVIRACIEAGEIKPEAKRRPKTGVERTRDSEARKIKAGGMRLPGVVLDAVATAQLRELAETYGSIAEAIRVAVAAQVGRDRAKADE